MLAVAEAKVKSRLRETKWSAKIPAVASFIDFQYPYARVCGTMRNQIRLFAVAGLLACGLIGASALHAQARRGITPEDYFSFQFVIDPHFSPDGKMVAYELTTIDQKKN